MSNIMVSVCVLSYNHEKYLRDCMEGIVMQRTTFPIEAWVHDDASTDKSQEIIKEYQQRYPEIIKPILQTENQYSKKEGSILNKFLFPNCIGKYIAICEGDDFWIDPYKLQKQVDYMESHPECTCYAHNSLLLKTVTQEIALFNKELFRTKDYELGEFLNKSWFTPTQSLMFRNDAYTSFEDLPRFMHGDYSILLNILLKKGSFLHYDNEIMSVYRDGGWASSNFKELDLFNDFITLLQYYKSKSNHRCDDVFDAQIEKQNQGKMRYIEQQKQEMKSKRLINRIWHRIKRIF